MGYNLRYPALPAIFHGIYCINRIDPIGYPMGYPEGLGYPMGHTLPQGIIKPISCGIPWTYTVQRNRIVCTHFPPKTSNIKTTDMSDMRFMILVCSSWRSDPMILASRARREADFRRVPLQNSGKSSLAFNTRIG